LVEIRGFEPLTLYMRIQTSDLCANKKGGRRVDEDFAVLGVGSITEEVLG